MSRKWNFLSLTILVLVICFFGEDYVEYVPGNGALEINPGDTSWMVVASAFVLLMTPGLAFFLWRNGRQKERHLHNAPKFCSIGSDQCSLGYRWF